MVRRIRRARANPRTILKCGEPGEGISGESPGFRRGAPRFAEVASVIGRLHEDPDLSAVLSAGGASPSHLDSFRTRFVEMFREDLRAISRSIPPFVSQETGFDDVDDLLATARHGRGENVYLVRFRCQPPGAWELKGPGAHPRPRRSR